MQEMTIEELEDELRKGARNAGWHTVQFFDNAQAERDFRALVG